MKRMGILLLCVMYLMAAMTSMVGCSINKEADKEALETENQEAMTDIEGAYTLNKALYDVERTQKNVELPFRSIEIKGNVKPYQIDDDLSNIENIGQFGAFAPEQKALLVKNGFVVNPTKEEQLFYIYENNEYRLIPSFITTDSVLQVYHIFYDYSLRTLEQDKLLEILEDLTESMLEKAVYLYDKIENEEIKKTQLKNIAYFGVAQRCLGKELPDTVEGEVRDFIKKEMKLIDDAQGFQLSAIFPYELDYSQFIPRGHYTRNEELKRYFKAMMWYGQAPFPLYKKDDSSREQRNIEQTLQALLITYSFLLDKGETSDFERWEKIYEPTGFYVGNADDLDFYQYRNLLLTVYGEEPDIDGLLDEKKLDHLYREAKKLPEPVIQAKYTDVTTPVGKQFRFMGQRYIPDSEIMQELVEPITRPIPSGLDVMGVLGSDRALEILIRDEKVEEQLPDYKTRFQKMRDKLNKLREDTWRSNMYYGWLWVLKAFTVPAYEGYPSFMAKEAWQDKALSTALGSWSELKHDTILYGKQSGAECGGGLEPPEVKGYVEPSIPVYERLLWLTTYSRMNLKEREILTESIENKMQHFEDLLAFLIRCSQKELNNEELTADEYYQLLTYGGMLEYLTSSFAGDGIRWFEITSDTDKNMAVIADIHTIAPNRYSSGGYLEVGVGPAHEIYVVVPIGGKLYLTRGAVFSYHEFFSKKRLTDEEWQKQIKEDQQPPQPQWTKSFIRGGKEELPMPAEPYSSGC